MRRALGFRELAFEIDPTVLSRWTLFTIDASRFDCQYWNIMDWLLFALVFAFVIVTIFLGICCFYSPKIKNIQNKKETPAHDHN